MYRYMHLGKRWDLVVEGKSVVERCQYSRAGLHVELGIDTRGFAVDVEVNTERVGWYGSIDIGLSEQEG